MHEFSSWPSPGVAGFFPAFDFGTDTSHTSTRHSGVSLLSDWTATESSIFTYVLMFILVTTVTMTLTPSVYNAVNKMLTIHAVINIIMIIRVLH